MIDLDALIPGCVHFRWREFLWCEKWACHVYPTPEQHKNLIKIAQKMDYLRNRIGKPIRITSGLRPFKYNELIGGSKASAHCEGKACDFQPVIPSSIDEVRLITERALDHLGLRMEHHDATPTWIHVDTKPPKNSRVFRP
jgi:uncharacterized protein YcbK (DUF882 family)